MILLAGLYLDPHSARLDEFLTSIERNAANREIAGVHVLVEEEIDPSQLVSSHPQLASPKVRLVVVGSRVTFRLLFDYANGKLAGRRVIIANTDIFFDRTLARLDHYDLAGWLLCLSRWDLHPDGLWRLFDYDMSQDAWIFQPPVPPFPCDFHLGVLGCENRLAWEADRAGLLLANPSRSVRAYHLHASGVRRYVPDRWLDGPARSVKPVLLDAAGIPRRHVERAQVPCAAVAFHQTMGYTVGRLQLGASSHNNDVRPFTAVPEPLIGRSFTQVVSRAASPIDVEFLSSGRLYVLAGTDWDGYYVATAWLGTSGEPEPMPPLETCHHPAFEVWSLVGERGDRFTIPTQVMLISDHLERRT
jgi:hypothetical protein